MVFAYSILPVKVLICPPVCMYVLRPGTGCRKKTTFVALRVTRAGILVSKGRLLGIGRCEVSWCLPSPVK